MKPIIFKYFPNTTITQLQIIYKAIVKLHFTPTLWKDARVIFIPKPGKGDYSTPKSFRPISLSNYLLKVLKELLTWHTDEMLLQNPAWFSKRKIYGNSYISYSKPNRKIHLEQTTLYRIILTHSSSF